jgi:hypothetical protein
MHNRAARSSWLWIAPLAIASALPALAGTPQPPDWVLTAAHASTPDYPKTTMAVALDDEETLTVQPDGKATLLKRRVIKILRPQGRGFATVVVPIDRDRKLHSLHVWSIAADGHPYTLRDNEISEVGDNPPPIPAPSSPTNTSAPCAPMCRSTPGIFRTASPPCTPSLSWSCPRTGTTP